MYYEIHGQGDPLLFLHGGGGMGADWQFLSHDWPFQIIAPDLPEHGHSTGRPGPWTHRAAAQDVLTLLDRLHIPKIKAIGISMGGNTLLHMATSQQVRIEAMVIVSATSYFGREARKFMANFPLTLCPKRYANSLWSAIPVATSRLARFSNGPRPSRTSMTT
jgi:pimeloyl-ACP methyl ester carboxylesterase